MSVAGVVWGAVRDSCVASVSLATAWGGSGAPRGVHVRIVAALRHVARVRACRSRRDDLCGAPFRRSNVFAGSGERGAKEALESRVVACARLKSAHGAREEFVHRGRVRDRAAEQVCYVGGAYGALAVGVRCGVIAFVGRAAGVVGYHGAGVRYVAGVAFVNRKLCAVPGVVILAVSGLRLGAFFVGFAVGVFVGVCGKLLGAGGPTFHGQMLGEELVEDLALHDEKPTVEARTFRFCEHGARVHAFAGGVGAAQLVDVLHGALLRVGERVDINVRVAL